SVPNTTSDTHVDDLRSHFSEQQIAGIVGVISLFGFLNRWNDTMATELEDEALDFAGRVLAPAGWEPGRHTAD
ncbi:MAG: carboxymuconolactone decarboxylase family protein, partial [Actinomycetota bacterium]